MSDLCICEYLDVEGERNHLLATCCNCKAIDDGFEGMISGNELSHETKAGIHITLQDRLRIPWIGGARKIPFDVALPLIAFPSLLLFATINVTCSIIAALIFIACSYIIYKYYIEKMPNFFITWTIASLIVLYVIFELLVVSFLQILLVENVWLSIFILGFVLCMFMLKRQIVKSREILVTSEKQFNKSNYCTRCKIYTTENNHHFWIDSCITNRNKYYYSIGLICALVALIYSSNLTLTSVCHPIRFYKSILLPDDCSEAYKMMELSLSFVNALYSCLLAIFILWEILMQVLDHICIVKKYAHRCSIFYWIRRLYVIICRI